MSRYAFHQPLKNARGITLVDTLIAITLIAMITGAIVGLFGAGIKSFTYSMRQTAALANARRALDMGDPLPGMAWQARQAVSATSLSASQLNLTTSGGLTPQYALSNQNLQITESGQVLTLATTITGLQFAYYNMSSAGLIVVSTSAASASLVTEWMQSQQSGQKTYTFFSGGRLRNHS